MVLFRKKGGCRRLTKNKQMVAKLKHSCQTGKVKLSWHNLPLRSPHHPPGVGLGCNHRQHFSMLTSLKNWHHYRQASVPSGTLGGIDGSGNQHLCYPQPTCLLVFPNSRKFSNSWEWEDFHGWNRGLKLAPCSNRALDYFFGGSIFCLTRKPLFSLSLKGRKISTFLKI